MEGGKERRRETEHKQINNPEKYHIAISETREINSDWIPSDRLQSGYFGMSGWGRSF